MALEKWAHIATIVGTLSIPLSGFFIWLQLRLQTRLALAANTQSLVALSSPLNLQLVQDEKVAEFWFMGADIYKVPKETKEETMGETKEGTLGEFR